mgnify:CR=1 FL=1
MLKCKPDIEKAIVKHIASELIFKDLTFTQDSGNYLQVNVETKVALDPLDKLTLINEGLAPMINSSKENQGKIFASATPNGNLKIDVNPDYIETIFSQLDNKVKDTNSKSELKSNWNNETFDLSPQVNYQLKAVTILSSDKAGQVFKKGEKNNWELNKILTELQIPKEQKQLILDLGITENKANVIIPIGTSGSGKSTFIKSLPQENLVVIEPDAMRVEFTGDMNDKSKDKEIYIEAANRAIQAVKQGKQVVFDTTNLTKDKRTPFIEAIKKALPNANIQYKLMELNPELAKQRIKADIAAGKNRANVPDSTIDRHAESYKQMLEDIKSEPISEFKGTDLREQIVLQLASNYSYSVEINTAKSISAYSSQKVQEPSTKEEFDSINIKADFTGDILNPTYEKKTNDYIYELEQDPETGEEIYTKYSQKQATENTQHYSNLTVNEDFYKNNPDWEYKEQRITTPFITPSIKGHAQFAEDNDIGWFRAWYNKKTGEVHVLEVQSDWGQKLRLKFVLDGITHYIEETKQGKKYWINDKEVNSNTYNKAFDDFVDRGEIIKGGTPEQIAFARLILRNWDEFSIKAIIQDSAKRGYEKVLFPTGNTASKVEGHTTLEEFKKQKEERIKELEKQKEYIKKEKIAFEGKLDTVIRFRPENYDSSFDQEYFARNIEEAKTKNWWVEDYFETKDVTEEFNKIRNEKAKTGTFEKSIEEKDKEINQLEQELADIEGPGGFGALKPIYNFYENTVSNILNKTYGKENVKVITDEYGNTWNEIVLRPIEEETFDLSPQVSDSSQPNFDTTLSYKRELVDLADKKIAHNKKLIEMRSGNISEVSRLTKENEVLSERRKVLYSELGEIKNLHKGLNSVERFVDFAYRDLRRLNTLTNSNDAKDLQEALVIADFYLQMDIDNPKDYSFSLYPKSEVFDEEGTLLFDEEQADTFREIYKKTREAQRILESAIQKLFMDRANALPSVKEMYGKLDYETLFRESSLRDTTLAERFLKPQGGIVVSNGIVPQILKQIADAELNKEAATHIQRVKKLAKVTPELQATMEKLGKVKSHIFGAGKVYFYDMFWDKDENGLLTNKYVSRATSKFNKFKANADEKYETALTESYKVIDPDARREKLILAKFQRELWYKNNTNFVDIHSLPEILNNPEYKDLLLEEVDPSYQGKLKTLLGEKGYKKEVAKQVELIEDFLVQKEIAISSIAELELSEEEAAQKLLLWEQRNSPFYASSMYNNNKTYYGYTNSQGDRVKVFSDFPYSNTLPKKMISGIDGLEESNYYNEDFKLIEEHDSLEEFHDILTTLGKEFSETMALTGNGKLMTDPLSMMGIRKTRNEMLLDPNMNIWERIATASSDMFTSMKKSFGDKLTNDINHAKIDPFTKKPIYTVSTDWYTSNDKNITNQVSVQNSLVDAVLAKEGKRLVNDKIPLDDMPEGIYRIIGDIYDIPANQAAFIERFPYEDKEAFSVSKIIKDGVTHNLVMDQSMDLPKVVKYHSQMLAEFKARNESLDLLKYGKTYYEDIKLLNKDGVEEPNSKRYQANDQMERYFVQKVLGRYGKNYELGKGTIPSEKGRLMDAKEDKLFKQIKELLEGDTLPEAEREKLKVIMDDLGTRLSSTASFGNFMAYIRFKFLGYSLASAAMNYAQGQISNAIVGNSGADFSVNSYYRAKARHRKNMASFLAMGLAKRFGKEDFIYSTVQSYNIVKDWNILIDGTEDLRKASEEGLLDKLDILNPMAMTGLVEFFNQTVPVNAYLYDTMVTSADGSKTVNYFEAVDIKNNLKPEFRSQENIDNWELRKGDKFTSLKAKIDATIEENHGDYSPVQSQAKSTQAGQAMLSMKSYLPKIVETYIGVTQDDLTKGRRRHKKVYSSHTGASGMVLGMSSGLLSSTILTSTALGGPIGLLAGGALGFTVGAINKRKKIASGDMQLEISFMAELAHIGKELAMNMARMTINNISGKEVLKTSSYAKYKGFDENDISNMKRIIMQINMSALGLAAVILAKMSLDDEDEEEKKWQNYLVDKLMTIPLETMGYTNPVNLVASLTDSTMYNVFDSILSLSGIMSDYLRNADAARGKLSEWVDKAVLPNALRFYKGDFGVKQNVRTFLDHFEDTPEDYAKDANARIRKEYKEYLVDELGVSKKEAQELTNYKYPEAYNNQSKVELYEKYLKIEEELGRDGIIFRKSDAIPNKAPKVEEGKKKKKRRTSAEVARDKKDALEEADRKFQDYEEEYGED